MSQYQETSFRSLFCRLSVFCMQSRAKSSFVKPRGYTGFSAYSSATQCFPPNIKSDQREMKSCCFFFSFFKARHIQRLKIFAVKVCSFPPLESYRSGIYVLHSSWRSPSITKSFLLLFFFFQAETVGIVHLKYLGFFQMDLCFDLEALIGPLLQKAGKSFYDVYVYMSFERFDFTREGWKDYVYSSWE